MSALQPIQNLTLLTMGFDNFGERPAIAAEVDKNLVETNSLFPDNSFGGEKISYLSVDRLVAGTITSQSINLAVLNGDGDVEVRSGIAAGDFANVGAASGFIFGIDDSDSDKTKFYWGNPANNIYYDGTTLAISGSFTATSGTIGGFEIGADYIRDVANSFGLSSTITGGNDVRIWAGETFANRNTAPIRIYEDGSAFLTQLTIGDTTITGTTITLGGGANEIVLDSTTGTITTSGGYTITGTQASATETSNTTVTKNVSDNTGVGDTVWAHGLSQIPSVITVTGALGGANFACMTQGTYDGSSQNYVGSASQGVAAGITLAGTGSIVEFLVSAGATQVGTLSVDATNVTITYVKTGSPSGTARLLITAQT